MSSEETAFEVLTGYKPTQGRRDAYEKGRRDASDPEAICPYSEDDGMDDPAHYHCYHAGWLDAKNEMKRANGD